MSRIRKHAAQRPGVFLVELLCVLVLLAAFSLLLGDLFVVASRVQRESVRRNLTTAQFDAAMATLRRDVWGATAFRSSAFSLELSRPPAGDQESQPIIWRQTEGALTRSIAGAADGMGDRSWHDMPPVRFSFAGPTVTVTISGSGAGGGGPGGGGGGGRRGGGGGRGGAAPEAGAQEQAVFISQQMLEQAGGK